jgi:predicted ATPase
LVVSEATDPSNRRKEIVPYDFSVALYNPKIGLLFKKVLQERISRLTEKELTEDEFYKVCYGNKFYKVLSLTTEQFKLWLEGKAFEASYIKKIVIENFFSVKNQQLELGDSREIYFLGENGDGKTLFLMALYLAFNGNYIKSGILKTEEIGRAIDILNENHMVQGFDELNHEYNIDNAIHLDHFYAYGTHRGRYSPVKYEGNGFMTLFDNDLMLMSPEQWLKDLKLNEQKELIKVVIASNELEKILYDLLEKNVKIVIEGSEVFFEEKGAQLKFHQLSEGYRSIIIFVCDLLYRLSSNVKEDTNIFKSKGIVLVDEIDQHLHLKWQRVIVKKLREIFPNIQFFFTTHSPTIIQGASDDAIIYRVYREEGYTKVSDPYFRKDLDHLMMNTLVTSSLFGLEDSRMDADFNYANTDDTYLIYRINNKIKAKLEEQKESGKNFISDNEIDYIIDKILKEELGDEKNT